MTIRCIALSSGGLDSMLAIRIMQEQGIEVEALNFKTVFTCCQDEAGQTARDLGVRVTVIGQEDDYLDLVREPQFGYGKGANPCVDCRIYMFEKAKLFMEQVEARFIVSGEVVGQRPMSQKRRDLDIISYHSKCEDLLLRPLSAKLLPPTLPERESWVDREKLYGFQGRSRKGLIALGKQLGLKNIPSPSTGCALTEPFFSQMVYDLIHQPRYAQPWDFELLKVGRHFRFDEHVKIVVGRDEAENDQLAYMHQLPEAASTAMLFPESFVGPRALLIGPANEAALDFAGALLLRYARHYDPQDTVVLLECGDEKRLFTVRPDPRASEVKTLATPGVGEIEDLEFGI